MEKDRSHEQLVINKDSIEEIRNIIFNRFNKQSVWIDGTCIGFPIVTPVHRVLTFDNKFSLRTLHTNEDFTVGDRIELYENHIILHEENDFIRAMLGQYWDTVKPKRIEIKNFDESSYQKRLVDSFRTGLQTNFSSNISFGKSMVGCNEGDYHYDNREDFCYALIDKIYEMLQGYDKIPNVVEKEMVVQDIHISVKINWEKFVEQGCLSVSGICKGKKFEDLVYLYLECLKDWDSE